MQQLQLLMTTDCIFFFRRSQGQFPHGQLLQLAHIAQFSSLDLNHELQQRFELVTTTMLPSFRSLSYCSQILTQRQTGRYSYYYYFLKIQTSFSPPETLTTVQQHYGATTMFDSETGVIELKGLPLAGLIERKGRLPNAIPEFQIVQGKTSSLKKEI